jgi:hypothetical protein
MAGIMQTDDKRLGKLENELKVVKNIVLGLCCALGVVFIWIFLNSAKRDSETIEAKAITIKDEFGVTQASIATGSEGALLILRDNKGRQRITLRAEQKESSMHLYYDDTNNGLFRVSEGASSLMLSHDKKYVDVALYDGFPQISLADNDNGYIIFSRIETEGPLITITKDGTSQYLLHSIGAKPNMYLFNASGMPIWNAVE